MEIPLRSDVPCDKKRTTPGGPYVRGMESNWRLQMLQSTRDDLQSKTGRVLPLELKVPVRSEVPCDKEKEALGGLTCSAELC